MNRTLVIGAVALTSIVFVGCKEKPYQLPKLEAIRAAEGARRNWLLMDDTSQAVSKVRQPIESFFNWLNEKTEIQKASKVRATKGLLVHTFGKLAIALLTLVNF